MFSLTMKLVHGYCLDEAALPLLISHYNPKCVPPFSDKELEHKVASAIDTTSDQPRGHLISPTERNQIRSRRLPSRKFKPPKIDTLANVEKFLSGFRCNEAEVIAASPCKLPPLIHGDHFHRQAAYLISMLYEPDDLINIVSDSKQNDKGKYHPIGYGETRPCNVWLKRLLDPLPNRTGGHWIRMNPMDGQGIADKNVTAFRYALFEFDDIPLELQLSLFAKLPLPIVAIIHSGGRSYHAWVQIHANSLNEYKDSVAKLYGRMGRFGVDRNNKNTSRMSRLPGVYRGDQQQRLVYLNPEPSTGAIL